MTNRCWRGSTIITIVLMLGVALVLAVVVPVYLDHQTQNYIRRAVIAIRPVQVGIERYLEANGRMPQGKDVAIDPLKKPEVLSRVDLEEEGKIRLHFADFGGLGGKSILVTPIVKAGKVTGWKCGGEIESKFLPPSCRD